MRRFRSTSATLASSLCLSGCLDLSPHPPRDAAATRDVSEPPRIERLAVLDARGDERPEDAIPRAPVLRLHTSSPLDGDPDPFLVLAGEPDDALIEDLRAAPLRATTSARTIACERSMLEGPAVEIRPREPLAPGAAIVVAVGGWARDPAGRTLRVPFVRGLRVSTDPADGARAIEAWPPDGSVGVGPTVPVAGVRFDGEVHGVEDAVWIEGPDGAPVPARAHAARCEEIGWPGEHCAVVVPARPLAPGAPHALRTGPALRDGTGASLPEWRASFTTALEPDREPPVLGAPSCALDEAVTEAGCVLADDRRIVLRLRASEPARVRATMHGTRWLAVAPRGETELAIEGLGPSAPVSLDLEVIDAAGNAAARTLELATTEPLALLAITEVRADPHGPEPRQEYVEVENRSATTVDLTGYHLSDHPSSAGDPIAGPAPIPAGARALIVPADFDAEDTAGGLDAPVPAGVLLVRVDRALGSGGLSNGGEPVLLRDPMGRRVSAAPAMPAREGVCIVRVAPDLRTGAVGSFEYDPGRGCTPGRAP